MRSWEAALSKAISLEVKTSSYIAHIHHDIRVNNRVIVIVNYDIVEENFR